MEIRWLGHSAFALEHDGTTVLVDPFPTGNPKVAGTINTPAGLVIGMGGARVYHLGDTALFSDPSLPAARDSIDVALVCVGGHFTMDPKDAVMAAELLRADRIVPCHYGTFPQIDVDAAAHKADVESRGHAEVLVLEPGASLPC